MTIAGDDAVAQTLRPNTEPSAAVPPLGDQSGASAQHDLVDFPDSIAQRSFFAAPFPQVPDTLYSHILGGEVVRQRERLTVTPHSHVSMDTYFGRFPASYWQAWTTVRTVQVETVVSGSGSVLLVAGDRHGTPRVLARSEVVDALDQPVRLEVTLDRFADGGAVWLEFMTGAGTLVAATARWIVATERELRPSSVVMCTFNRVDDCLYTLETLAADEQMMRVVDTVHVVDQGDDLVDSHSRFAPVRAVLGDKLRYLQQPNLGGAGGFTRGLYEVVGTGEQHANVLFMDDDILLEPDTVLRLTEFANHAVAPVIVGAQMFLTLHPEQCYSWAQDTNLARLDAGVPVPSGVLHVDATRVRQNIRVDAGYNAWWSCLVPPEIVAAVGYPLPVFFQWDDVEYGHRARAGGFRTVTLPGAGVWHADWNWKDEDAWANYFNHRNVLITAALHSEFEVKTLTRVLRHRLLRYLVSMRYGLAATVLRAIQDFLDGPAGLHDGGLGSTAMLSRLRSDYAETHQRPLNATLAAYGESIAMAPAGPHPSRERVVMVKRLLWQLRGKPRGIAAISLADAHWWHVSLFGTAVVTDAGQGGVRVRELDRRELLRLGWQVISVLRRFRREGANVRQRYRAALPELTSRENWQRIFCLDTETVLPPERTV